MKTALFTPGPGNTSDDVRAALNCDIGTRTPQMTALTQHLRQQIAEVAECGEDFSVVPIQGSGTFAVEAMLTSLLPMQAPCLVLVNGPYGERMAEICQIYALPHYILRSDPLRPINAAEVADYLGSHPDIAALALIHFETGIGILNPLAALLALAQQRGIRVFVDSMSAFGLLPIEFTSPALSAVAASSNKVLHGAPGVGLVIARHDILAEPRPARTLSLNLQAQYCGFQRDGMWRFTPPVQVIAALSRAIGDYLREGGQTARLQRYQRRASRVIAGLAEFGIRPLVPESYGAPVIVTFVLPFAADVLSAGTLSERLLAYQLAIYPSQVSEVNSFRIGFIGELTENDVDRLVVAIGEVVSEIREQLEQPA
ncbi:2-aminoethylphosphonate--pyruvate transaminase [Serratia entomophila]|uniref:2-aminoethylphosphonate--pyruvate transaminase n=1 Tax=Serratia entomophila TaxID=42906 RepID=UPI00217B29DF|nr:2-aminoethylphosphonate--pyruvate transaminase [Serratia entomophila]CAI1163984.1 2-aminoethylphosphonate--pyruvate transaminase [Serratia entomophila]CAI1734974.1 2-aminoethylphosphonate--pyruvate transaminase [Serratia entomophila]CAI1901485.1 2-aminoethylphosphonate--pyruvate transaminase [Serratia entomophila]CAI1907241.1 2-aminoethylphosphonate--pyruvate transaminase [Serratia entomophila]CAI1993869.1 2-aminoethylphosphonate--pyruvate transaminase [Serratia entomophila]